MIVLQNNARMLPNGCLFDIVHVVLIQPNRAVFRPNESQEQLKKDMEKEKAKDERVKKQGTVQSKLIEQRKKDLPAIDFESSEDDLSGFDLNSFTPR